MWFVTLLQHLQINTVLYFGQFVAQKSHISNALPGPKTLQPNTESEQLLSCWHIVFGAQGDDPAVLHLQPLDAALSVAHLNQLCLAPVKPQKNRGWGGRVSFH